MDMGRKKAETATGETDAAPKRGKGRLLVTIGLCAGLAGGGYVLGGRSVSAEPQAAAELGAEGASAETPGHGPATATSGDDVVCEPVEPPEMGPVVDLPALSVNLADGHYLRVAVSLALAPDVELAEPAEFKSAPAKDLVVSTLSGRSMDELSDSAGRERVKVELTEQIVEAYHGEVDSVFFTEFVMQ